MKFPRGNTSGSAPKKRPDKMSLRYVLPLILFFVIVGVLLIWLSANGGADNGQTDTDQ